MPQVPLKLTPHTDAQLAPPLQISLTDSIPNATATTAAILLAHVRLETANGQKLRNENPGNLTTASTTDDWFVVGTNPLHFRSYDTLSHGMYDYVQDIVGRKPMIDAAVTGDVDAFAKAIASTGYTPGADTAAAADSLGQIAKSIVKAGTFSMLGPGPALAYTPLAKATTSTTTAQGSSSDSTAAKIVFGLLVVGIVGGGIYLVVRKPKSKSKAKVKPEPEPEPKDEP